MIHVTRTTTGLLLQRDATEIVIDGPAVPLALGPIIAELVGCGRAIADARRSGYEDGLIQGRANAAIELETSARIAERQAHDLADSLIGVPHANAA